MNLTESTIYLLLKDLHPFVAVFHSHVYLPDWMINILYTDGYHSVLILRPRPNILILISLQQIIVAETDLSVPSGNSLEIFIHKVIGLFPLAHQFIKSILELIFERFNDTSEKKARE